MRRAGVPRNGAFRLDAAGMLPAWY
jgi:hypothetical protein